MDRLDVWAVGGGFRQKRKMHRQAKQGEGGGGAQDLQEEDGNDHDYIYDARKGLCSKVGGLESQKEIRIS